MKAKRVALKSARSIADRRPSLVSPADALTAQYGAGDLLRVADLSRTQLKTWIREGVIEHAGQAGGLRVFDLRELVLAAVAQSIASTGSKISLKRIMRHVRARWDAEHITVEKLLGSQEPVRLTIELVGEVAAGSNITRNPQLKPAGEPKGEPVSLTLKVNLTEIAARIVALLINPDLAAAEDNDARAESA